jgi:hypothetical protein
MEHDHKSDKFLFGVISMSTEKLKSVVETGNLIGLNIVSDSLTRLLNKMAKVLVDQQLRKDLSDSVSWQASLSSRRNGGWTAEKSCGQSQILLRNCVSRGSTVGSKRW